ncbi:MAG TPA: methionine--tRNA ligase [Micromonosporaceae bacterium]|jgi:methionyl-tRNA synthetase
MTYLTTPIYYVNDAPHIGHAYTTVIADALSRWHRLNGRPTRLITGTDEHGLKVQRAAEAAGVAPATLATANAARFRAAWDRLGIGYDDFVRTTEERHREVATALLQRVYDRGLVELGRYEGRYCVGCEAYAAVDVCPIHRRPTEWVSEENWFFRLSACGPSLADWYARCPNAVRPAIRRNEALGLLRQGLADFSISRASISWGVPLPWDPKQVAYVWFDALGAYLTAGGWTPGSGSSWWPAHHLIGKDILRFHAIYWPAILLGAGLEPPDRVTVHGFLLDRGDKISKSGRRASSATLDDLIDLVGADGLRYALLRSTPVGPDGDFSVAGVVARYNADLANTLGNLVARVTALVGTRHDGLGPAPASNPPLSTVAARAVDEAAAAWSDDQPAAALAATWRLVAAANAYLVSVRPWAAAPADPDATRAIGDVLDALRIVALLAWPAIPGAAAEIWRRVGLDGITGPIHASRLPAAAVWGGYPGGTAVSRGTPLFPRLSGDTVPE